MRMPENFDAEVYAVVAEIPAGRVVSYKQIARLIGMPDHARRVGRALAEAPAGLPCHRVVNSAGRTVPGWTRQRELLEAEGVRFKANGCADLARCGWEEIRSRRHTTAAESANARPEAMSVQRRPEPKPRRTKNTRSKAVPVQNHAGQKAASLFRPCRWVRKHQPAPKTPS